MPYASNRSPLVRSSSRLLASLLATGATVAWAQPPLTTAPAILPSQSAPVNIETLPPGTILPPGIVAAPRTTLPPGAVPGGATVAEACDYWIVSSRNCRGRPAPSNTGCLNYFHRTSERNLADVGRDAFLASVRPDRPVCFVVHGSYNRWNDVVTESRKIDRWVRSASPGAPVQVVFFTWPSDGNMPFIFPVDIAMLGRKASQHSFYLAQVIGQLPSEQPVSVLGHSHGARSAVAALHLLGGGAIEDGQMLAPGYSTPRLRAVLIAAAIDHNWLNPGQRYSHALHVPEQVLLMRNSRDATLAIYPLRFGRGGRALGREGLGAQKRFVMDQMGKKVVELDAAQFAGPNHSFADYHERTELASAIVPYIHFEAEGNLSDPTPVGPNPAAATARRMPQLGEPEPIAPIQRASTKEEPSVVGPKLMPAALPPSAKAAEASPRTEADDGPVKIYPKSRSASRGAKSAESSSPPAKDDSPKPKKKNPFQLRLEP